MRGINDGHDGVRIYIGGDLADEMSAFDQFGPRVREVLHDLPIRYSAACLMQQLKDIEAERRLQFPELVRKFYRIDPCDPQVDASMANGLRDQTLGVLLKDALFEDREEDAKLGMVPLVPNIGVKSVRERRRSLRKRW